MKTLSKTLPRPAFLLAAFLLAAPALRAQVPTEGYDPMRQITAQFMKANLHIVQDVTGSMTSYPESPDDPPAGVNGFGYLAWSNPVGRWNDGSRCSETKCPVWDYTLGFSGPSRMGIVKNALGSSVPLVTSYAPPGTLATRWTLLGTSSSTASVRTWTFRYTSPSNASSPGAPFVPYETITIPGAWTDATRTVAYTVSNFPKVVNGACTVGTCTYYPPQNLIGKNTHRVNWGLTTYSESATTRVFLDTSDRNSELGKLLDYFLPSGATGLSGIQGLGAGGFTNTRGGLAAAKTAIETSAATDPKRACNRPYGVILVTDGLSNNGNPAGHPSYPNGGNWISPCGTGFTTCDPDKNTSGIDCPNSWDSFAAHEADELYKNTTAGGVQIPVRTWTIGVSAQVGPCELDFIAYMGRTDADSPVGDAGWGGYHVTKNPFIPGDSSVETYYDGPTGQYKWYKNTTLGFGTALAGTPPNRAHGHNAYFATSADKLAESISAIVNATATGDYATNAPVSGMSAALDEMVYLPSTEFPSWRGHLYAFNTEEAPADDDGDTVPYLKWDAAAVLNSKPASQRKIFTWNPTTKALVEVTRANLATLATYGGAGFTGKVVDFIRGDGIDLNDDGDTADPGETRIWRLGPLINSAPALVGPPSSWVQGSTMNHKPFEIEKTSRTALIWVGSNQGMMHAFRLTDGVEQIALLPPALLAKQVELYQNYVADERKPKIQSGQPVDTDAHVYGVANSFRFGDVWDGTLSTPAFRTIGIVTAGPGSDDLVAVDVTDVPSPTAATYPSDPVRIVWTKNSTSLAGLQQTWSIPAMAPVAPEKWRLVVGSGFRPGNTVTAQTTNTGFVQPNAFTLDPTSGALLATSVLTSDDSPAPLVGNQAFADAVLLNPYSKFYQEDNVARLALQADLNGRIWFITSANASQLKLDDAEVGIDASAKAGVSQPLYYSPAASGYGQGSAGCVAYAFGSGSLYERSAAVNGTSATFVPNLFVATTTKAAFSTALSSSNIAQRAVRGVSWPLYNPTGPAGTITFGSRTQLTGPPFMLVPRSGRGSVTALYLLYDPDRGCFGNSYVAVIDFIGSESCQPTNLTYMVFDAGAGAASGFTIAGDKVLVSKSGVGEGQRAGLFEPPGIAASTGGIPVPKVRWWKELK